MAVAHIVLHAFIIAPKLELLVLASGYEMFALLADSQGVDFALFRAIEHSDSLAVEQGPVSDFPIAASRENLTLLWMVQYLFEQSLFLEAVESDHVFDVPDYATAIGTGRDRL